MWEQIKTSKNNVILYLSYEEFADIKVEKKVNSKGILFYEVSFHIENITDQSIEIGNINQVSKILERAKYMIEELYEEYDDLSNASIYQWLDEFIDEINNY